MQDTLTESKEQVAQLTGFSVDQIGVVRLQLNQLLQEGVLIDLNITGESMFTRLADWSEIGIQVGEVRSSRLTRGQKYLISESRIKDLRSVTTRMRQWLEKMTNDITGFRPYRYLSYKRYDAWVEKWAELLVEFGKVKQDILKNYDQDIADLRKDYYEIADRSWQSIIAQGYGAIIYDNRGFTNKAEFAEHMIKLVLEKVPSKATIERELNADYRVSIIQGREQIEEEYLRSEKIRAEAQVVKAEAQAKESEVYLQTRILMQKKDHEAEMFKLAEQEKAAKIEAMIRAEASHIREQFAETVSPIEEVFTQLRKEMAEVCIEAADSIKKNGFVRGKTAEKLRGLVEFYELSSIQEDPKLLKKLQELKTAVGLVGDARTKDTPERSASEVVAALNGVIDLQNTVRADLAEAPTRTSFIL